VAPTEPSEPPEHPRGALSCEQVEWDDGNGMWITSGVSVQLCTCFCHGVRRSATLPQAGTDPPPLTPSSLVPSPLPASLATQQASAPRTGEALVTRRSWREKALMSGGIPNYAGSIALTRPATE
jgi:hypothetical protein